MSAGLFSDLPPALRPTVSAQAKPIPCPRRWSGLPQHRCAVGGGDAAYSIDSGKTWLCRKHAGIAQ